MKPTFMAPIFLFLSTVIWLGAAAGTWIDKVPPQERQKANPYRGQVEAIQAGQLLFHEHCSSCHGVNAEGNKKHPSLRSARIQSEATEGDLHWLLVNGDLRHGMPSWSKLPDPQLWQIVSYLKSLKPIN
ncbi:MAG TPA: c-type cytochrome [Alphaproteobacteria bacterium]|nr:c-type cytochrome [Alphaproteobacteria bacterium]